MGIGQTFDPVLSISKSVQADLRSTVFVINECKSIWNTSLCLDWLGYSIDTVRFVLSVSSSRKYKAQETGREIVTIFDSEKLL